LTGKEGIVGQGGYRRGSVPKQERGRASHPTALYTDFLIPQVLRTCGGELPQRRSVARELAQAVPGRIRNPDRKSPARDLCDCAYPLPDKRSHQVRASSLPGEASRRTKPAVFAPPLITGVTKFVLASPSLSSNSRKRSGRLCSQ